MTDGTVVTIANNGYSVYDPIADMNSDLSNLNVNKVSDVFISGKATVSDGMLVVCNAYKGEIWVINIANPESPVLVSNFEISGNPDLCLVTENYILIPVKRSGLMKITRSAKERVMKTTLLIMAAGIGSRFGTGIKQLEPVDDAGHIIMDYSIHDAIEAGFNHVVFIIRKDIEKEFKEVIGDRIASICSSHNVSVDYAFQDINDIPGTLPEGRTKPWGTGQAVLAAKKVIKTPFIVINADDYYGKEGFKAVHEYLVNGGKSCMAGFVLKNTLSDNGGVTRGICKMDEDNNLTEVVETKNIVKTANGAETDGVAVDVNSLVSMNMWGLTPDFLDVLEEGFKEFFEKEVPGNSLKAEYLIPIFIGELLEQGKMSVKVLKTNDTWYGMTYHEDVAAVKGSFKEMLENGVYKADLFSDL